MYQYGEFDLISHTVSKIPHTGFIKIKEKNRVFSLIFIKLI